MERPQAMAGRRARRGLTLIEAALALMVAAVVMVGLAQLISGAADTSRARVTADRLQQVTAAAKSYIQANFSQLYADAATAPVVVRAVGTDGTSLRERGFLPSTYVDQNAFGQQHAVVIRRIVPNPPVPGVQPRLEAVVTTQGGTPIPDRMLGQIATFMGADAGFMLSSPPATLSGQITGVGGGWQTPATLWTAGAATPAPGHVMASMAFNEGVLVGDYLHRRDIGIPEANTMRTSLNMAGSDVNNIRALTGNGNTVTMSTGQVDVNTSLNVANNVVAGNNMVAGNNVVAGGEVTGDRFIDGDNSAFRVDPNATSRVNALDVSVISGNTRVATAATGSALLSGTLADRLPNYVTKGGYYVVPGAQLVAKPACGPGGQQKITYSVIQDSFQFASYVTYAAGYQTIQNQNIPNLRNNEIATARRFHVSNYSGSHWLVQHQGTPNHANIPWSGLAMTYCYYP